MISIPIDNTSVNPARSLATAVYAGGWAMSQLWVFIVFPIVGGLLVSQALTLFTTPVLYLYFDRLGGLFRRRAPGPLQAPRPGEA